MKLGEGRSSGQEAVTAHNGGTEVAHGPIRMPDLPRRRVFRSVLCLLVFPGLLGCCGCALDRLFVDKNLMADRDSTVRAQGVTDHYLVGCPDVLEVSVAGRNAMRLRRKIEPDGRINLSEDVRPRIEGRTLHQAEELIAAEMGINARDVTVKVVDFRSQQIYLFGEIVGWQRSIPYQGQETVLDLLQRVGGITRGAEPDEVYVVRSHVADGQRPEIFHVDLNAIVLKREHKTNLRLLPGDQVFVGETRQSRVERVVPPWLRPVYRTIWRTNLDPEDRPKRLNRATDS